MHRCLTEIQRQRSWRIREIAFFLCQAEGKTQQASASRTVPPPPLPTPPVPSPTSPHTSPTPASGTRRRFYLWGLQSRVYDKDPNSEGLAFFFFLHYFKTVTAGIRQPCNWVPLSQGYWQVNFLKCKCYKG